jgi:hypothetical protein
MILRIFTWVMMVIAPLIYLHIAWLLDTQGLRAKAGNDLMLYLLLVVSLLSPLVLPLVTNGVIKAARTKRSQETGAQLLQRLSIIQMALIESIYIYGFIAFNLTGKFAYIFYFYPIGIAWSFVYWPRREKYTQLLEKLNRP